MSGNAADTLYSYGSELVLNGGDITAEYKGTNDMEGAVGSSRGVIIDENMTIVLPDGGNTNNIGDGFDPFHTIIAPGETRPAKEVHVVSLIHNTVMTQAGTVYGSALADPVFELVPGADAPVIRYEGTLLNGETYTKQGTKPARAGEYVVSVLQKKGTEEWRSSAKFRITPKPVTAVVKAIDREYNGEYGVELSTKAEDRFVLDNEEGDLVGVVIDRAEAFVESPDVSENAAVIITGVELGGRDAYNYVLSEQPSGVKVSITRTGKTVEPVTVEVESGMAGTKDLKELIEEGGICARSR
ncbi:MAG: hypothetical protein K5686_06480 [Lachnospiraceae bacterium]|nr:hypothetical protein [Lachnospiraceae bacterium]